MTNVNRTDSKQFVELPDTLEEQQRRVRRRMRVYPQPPKRQMPRFLLRTPHPTSLAGVIADPLVAIHPLPGGESTLRSPFLLC